MRAPNSTSFTLCGKPISGIILSLQSVYLSDEDEVERKEASISNVTKSENSWNVIATVTNDRRSTGMKNQCWLAGTDDRRQTTFKATSFQLMSVYRRNSMEKLASCSLAIKIDDLEP